MFAASKLAQSKFRHGDVKAASAAYQKSHFHWDQLTLVVVNTRHV